MTGTIKDYSGSIPRTGNLLAAFALFFVWCAATWFLEGRIETLLRPDAIADRIIYAILGNLVLGVIGALLLIRWQQSADGVRLEEAGFGAPGRSAFWIVLGIVLGLGLYVGQGAPSTDPVVVLNAYAQVFVVSAAEVLVCWAVLGSTIVQVLRPRGRFVATVAAGISVSILFGLYHFAHSPPFNTIGMVQPVLLRFTRRLWNDRFPQFPGHLWRGSSHEDSGYAQWSIGIAGSAADDRYSHRRGDCHRRSSLAAPPGGLMQGPRIDFSLAVVPYADAGQGGRAKSAAESCSRSRLFKRMAAWCPSTRRSSLYAGEPADRFDCGA